MKIHFAVLSFLGGVAALTLADNPKQAELAKKPQWQRKLTAEDEKTVDKLRRRIGFQMLVDNPSEAIKSAKELLALRTNVQGEDHWNTIDARNEISFLEKLAAATPAKRQELRAAGERAMQAGVMDAQARFKEARAVRERHLELCREIVGEHHHTTARCYSDLGYGIGYMGKFDEAEPHFRKSLDIHLKVNGAKHPFTAHAYNYLAANLNIQGKIAEAETLFRKNLDILLEVYGANDPNTAHGYHNFAGILGAQGRAAEAETLLRKALEIHLASFGMDHPSTATSYGGLAMSLQAQGKVAEAERLYRNALEIYLKVNGEYHPDTGSSHSDLAINLHLQEKPSEAEPFARKALDIHRRISGENHPSTAANYYQVAFMLQTQGKSSEAEPLVRKALEINRKILGENNSATAGSYDGLARNLLAQGKAAEAEPFARKALDIHRKVLGENHPFTASMLTGVADILQSQRKADEAESLYRKALEIHRNLQGENHAVTAASYGELAHQLRMQGKTAEAEAVLVSAVRSHEAARIAVSTGIDRANFKHVNPRLALAGLHAKTNPSAAWNQLERSLARGLLDQQALDRSSTLTSTELQSRQAARSQLATLQPRILFLVARTDRSPAESRELEQILAQRRELNDQLAALAVAESERAVASDDRIRAALGPNAALLYWIDVADKSGRVQDHWGCVVRFDGVPRIESLPGSGPEREWTAEDSSLPQAYAVAAAGAGSTANLDALARRLYAQRIAPMLKHLQGVTILHVVGTGSMAGVPVEAFAADFTVNYVPSGSYLVRLMGQPKPAGDGLFALGDPQYPAAADKPSAASLPAAGLLVQQVVPGTTADKAGLKPGDVLLTYAGKDLATVDTLKEQIETHLEAKTITLTFWRETEAKPGIREVAPGKLGVVLDPEPAPAAIAARRKSNETMARLARGGDWAELPGTAIELARLRALLPDNTILDRADASLRKLSELQQSNLLKGFRYLHFATHGEADNSMAFRSSLVLHGNATSVARLTAEEIMLKWKLDAELVTLSACETAIGKKGGGDGLLGFAQAFLTAGARSVCLSLWKVDDAATALLMSRFYENLLGKRDGLAKPMGKAAALDEAKRWLRNLSAEEALALTAKISNGVARGTRAKGVDLKVVATETKDAKPFAHPKYWAAFILIGDPN
jgi:tetratricopeptide (TPR) repeat protein